MTVIALNFNHVFYFVLQQHLSDLFKTYMKNTALQLRIKAPVTVEPKFTSIQKMNKVFCPSDAFDQKHLIQNNWKN